MTETIKRKLSDSSAARWTAMLIVSFTMMCGYFITDVMSPLGDMLTLSGGITTCVPDDSTNSESMIMRADQALYAAKAQGRNRFFSFEMQMDTVEQRRG